MAHLRKRYLEALVRKGLTFKGIVGVFGHRQVGKTTLLENLCKRYVTLDSATTLNRASENPEYFIQELAKNTSEWPAAIDECQMVPPLFPSLKEWARKNKKPGAFLLSGSVRFSSRKAIRESLTGRLLGYELLPFSISELEGRPINTLALDLIDHDFRTIKIKSDLVKGLKQNSKVKKYLETGGLPGICFVRDERERFELLESQLNLILDRDLRLVCETTLSFQRLRFLYQILAQTQNQPLNISDISRKSRISAPSLRKVLTGFESIFLLMIPCEGDERSPVYFLEDQGEAFFMANRTFDVALDLERLAFSHLRIPFAYSPGIRAEIFQYRRHGGAYIPFAYRIKEKILGYICMLDEHPSLSEQKSAQSFIQFYPGAKVVYLHGGKRLEALTSDELILPIEAVF